MTDNLRIWDALSKTDPKHTKSFKRAGGFQGTAIKPIWLTKRLTEKFGPAGTGWGMDEPKFQTVPAGDEILVFCTVALWYLEGERRTVYGVGGDKVMGNNKYGPFTNDEAFKASYTDALSNAMKQIGMGADIHMGMFEDEKYVRETTREFANAANNGSGSAPPADWVDDAKKDGLIKGDATKSQYEVDKLKKAVDNDWVIVNTTPKGKEDQAFAYLEMARNPDDVAKITGNNAATIEGAPWQGEFDESVEKLLRWFEKQSAPALQ